MDITKILEQKIEKVGSFRVSEIVEETGLSRAYVQRIAKNMQKNGDVKLIGRANQAKYVSTMGSRVKDELLRLSRIQILLKNKDLNEDIVFDRIVEESGVLTGLNKNVVGIFNYAFTEMLNNAIDHSNADEIVVVAERFGKQVSFDISDNGIGIFQNIKEKKGLHSILEAIQDLLKGKQTTAPEAHSGEGIFFTSRVADRFVIYGSGHKLIFDNILDDVFLSTNPSRKGTRVHFELSLGSDKNIADIFGKYSNPETYKFDKTEIRVELYKNDTVYISRSQARRILFGLGDFDVATLDFTGVRMIGQGFADEVFRVWVKSNPEKKVSYINAVPEVEAMIEHVLAE